MLGCGYCHYYAITVHHALIKCKDNWDPLLRSLEYNWRDRQTISAKSEDTEGAKRAQDEAPTAEAESHSREKDWKGLNLEPERTAMSYDVLQEMWCWPVLQQDWKGRDGQREGRGEQDSTEFKCTLEV